MMTVRKDSGIVPDVTVLAKGRSWFPRATSKPQTRLRLFCFPYAGGDALAIFRKWSEILPSAVEVCPVQIPGRGTRVSEAPIANLASIVKAIGEAIPSYLDKPFAFFGHSMGAMISFELARLLRRERGIEPCHLFVSGRKAPQVPCLDPPTYNLSEPEFLQELQRINGTPKEALENLELMRLLLPVLQADFQLCQTYHYTEERPLSCPITVLGGLGDETTREDLEAWRVQTRNLCSLHLLAGDHFFIKTAQKELLALISIHLARILSAPGMGLSARFSTLPVSQS